MSGATIIIVGGGEGGGDDGEGLAAKKPADDGNTVTIKTKRPLTPEEIGDITQYVLEKGGGPA